MRLVPGMGTPMDSQGTALYEGLLAWLVVACIRPFIGMDAVVSLEIGFAIEALRWRNEVSVSIDGLTGVGGNG